MASSSVGKVFGHQWLSRWLKFRRSRFKVRLGKRQRQNSIPPLNLEELKEDKAVQFAAEVTNRFTALDAAQNEVTPEDLWKGTKTVLL